MEALDHPEVALAHGLGEETEVIGGRDLRQGGVEGGEDVVEETLGVA